MPRVAIIFEGSRGDSQPYIAAGANLKAGGFDVLLAGAPDFEAIAKQFGLPFIAYLPPAEEMMKDPRIADALTNNDFFKAAALLDVYKKEHPADMSALWKGLQEFKPDILLGGAFTYTSNFYYAKALGCASLPLYLQCTLPSNYLSVIGLFPYFPPWTGINKRLWLFFLRNAFYRQTVKEQLPLMEKATGFSKEEYFLSEEDYMSQWYGEPIFPIFTLSSSILNPSPPDFSPKHIIIGPQVIKNADQTGIHFGGQDSQAMEAFLASGEAPVYMGFGSITCKSGKWMTLLCLRALKLTGKRGILLKGWAGMGVEHIKGEPDELELEAYIKSSVLFLDTAPHGSLFPRCAVIVHHGGAGTFNASLRSGKPTVIVPIIVDQFNHSTLLNEHGVGVGMKKMLKTTPKELSAAILKCCENIDIIKQAREFGEALELETQEAPARLVAELSKYYNEAVATGKHQEIVRERHQQFAKRSLLTRFAWCCS